MEDALTPYSESEDGHGFDFDVGTGEGTSTIMRREGLPSAAVSDSADVFSFGETGGRPELREPEEGQQQLGVDVDDEVQPDAYLGDGGKETGVELKEEEESMSSPITNRKHMGGNGKNREDNEAEKSQESRLLKMQYEAAASSDVTSISCSEGVLPEPPKLPSGSLPQQSTFALHQLTADQRNAVDKERALSSDHVRLMNHALAGHIAFEDLVLVHGISSGSRGKARGVEGENNTEDDFSYLPSVAKEKEEQLANRVALLERQLEETRNDLYVLKQGSWSDLLLQQDRVIRDLRCQLANVEADLARERREFFSPSSHSRNSKDGEAHGGPQVVLDGQEGAAVAVSGETARRVQMFVDAKVREVRRLQMEVSEWQRRCLASSKRWSELDKSRKTLSMAVSDDRLVRAKLAASFRAALAEKDSTITALRESLAKLAAGGTAKEQRKDAASFLVAQLNDRQSSMRRMCNDLVQQVLALREGNPDSGIGAGRDQEMESLRKEVETLRGDILDMRAQGGVAAVIEAQEIAGGLQSELAMRQANALL